MILDEITVHDFGLYAGRQTIRLTPPSPDQPIILFGGLNGHGKTTLLDALQLCLYGPFASISNRNDLSYPDYLSRCIHRKSLTREAAIEVAFRHTVDGQEDHYRLHRSWKMKKSGCKEHFEVTRNHRCDRTLSENWISYVEGLIPANISSLFFFDGEQVEQYASPANSAHWIGTAVRNLLGLDIVDQLEKDLITYARRKRTEDKTDPKRGEIEETEAQLKELQIRSSDLKQEQAALKTTQLEPAHKALLATEEKYRRLGGELYDLRIEIERELEAAERSRNECAERLRELAGAELPLVLVRDLLTDIQDQDRKEEDSRRSRQVLMVLEDRDQEFFHQMQMHDMDQRIMEPLWSYLEEDRDRHRKIGKQETVLDLRPEARSDLHLLLHHRLDELGQNAAAELEASEEANNNAEHARLRSASIPGDDVISEVNNRRKTLIDNIASLERQYAGVGDELDRLAQQYERGEQAFLRMIESKTRMEGEHRDRTRILHYSSRVRTTLGAFRGAVIARHVHRIGQLVLESYQQLLRKTSLVTRLEIHPETFALTLDGRDGKRLSAERLSAGERQLLATALLWGLSKASGRALPTAIDTPLGRLDAGHRQFLVERYLPFASHQVLLFSTDEEIVGPHHEALKPFIGRSYRLCYDDSTGSTRVREGYFDQREAA